MKTSSVGKALIKQFEGTRPEAYYCPAGVLTIGVGHTGPDVRPGMRITQAQSDTLLATDLVRFEKAVSAAVKVTLTQNQFDALVSFTFNLGVGALQSSTLLKLLNAGDYAGAKKQFAAWNKLRENGVLVVSKGLTKRRTAEAALFLK